MDDDPANVVAATEAGWVAHTYSGTCALNDLFRSYELLAVA